MCRGPPRSTRPDPLFPYTTLCRTTHPLAVHHSWPLYERALFFELGQLHRCETLDPIPDVVDVAARLAPGRAPIGQWECDLTDNNRLSWSDAVYDIFGIPRGAAVTRAETVALYAEGSRAARGNLRTYSIKHRQHGRASCRARGGKYGWNL